MMYFWLSPSSASNHKSSDLLEMALYTAPLSNVHGWQSSTTQPTISETLKYILCTLYKFALTSQILESPEELPDYIILSSFKLVGHLTRS